MAIHKRFEIVNRSTCNEPVRVTWETCARMFSQRRRHGSQLPTRREVVAACVAKGVDAGTASQQYYKFLKWNNIPTQTRRSAA